MALPWWMIDGFQSWEWPTLKQMQVQNLKLKKKKKKQEIWWGKIYKNGSLDEKWVFTQKSLKKGVLHNLWQILIKMCRNVLFVILTQICHIWTKTLKHGSLGDKCVILIANSKNVGFSKMQIALQYIFVQLTKMCEQFISHKVHIMFLNSMTKMYSNKCSEVVVRYITYLCQNISNFINILFSNQT